MLPEGKDNQAGKSVKRFLELAVFGEKMGGWGESIWVQKALTRLQNHIHLIGLFWLKWTDSAFNPNVMPAALQVKSGC